MNPSSGPALMASAVMARRGRHHPSGLGCRAALVAHLRHHRAHPVRVFEPRQPPFTAERSYDHVGNTVRSLLMRAAIVDRGVHALRHTAATAMVNGGASFKDVADILGHRSLATTLIYAKLDLGSLMQVALPWPGGGR
jgi:integrase